MVARILIIEDDPDMARSLQLELRLSSYEVVLAEAGNKGIERFQDANPDLVLLDLSLPDINGLTVCQRIREISDVPILMMTAQEVTEQQIAEGLNTGADEFMRKPLPTIEFQARIRALLRRAKLFDTAKNQPLIYQDPYLTVDLQVRRVIVNGEEIRLTPTEFKLLATFIRHPGEVLTFQQLLEQVWGFEYTTEHHYPRIYVSHLRRKIEPDAKNPTYIQNEYGIGYRFVSQNQEGASQ
ncbi:MAG: response regulator transcription factor [Phototrophicaceae bacterium]|jgi:two-component system KDP operon response regulator KdpE